MPDRRFECVNVVCIIVLACLGGKRDSEGWVRGPRNWTVDSEHGAREG